MSKRPAYNVDKTYSCYPCEKSEKIQKFGQGKVSY